MKKIVLVICCFLINTSWANEFKSCNDAEQFSELSSSLCTVIQAPLSYKGSDKKIIDLFIRKFPSLEERQGSIWLVAGGPGESGASFYSIIDIFRKSFPYFDIFIPDHRGTGLSSSICPGEDISSMAGKVLVGKEWGECFSYMYSNLEYVESFNITNAAKDLNFLINTLSGKGKKYVYGVSYGTQLVLRATQLDNSNLNGIILDSLVPMQDDMNFDLSHRSQVVNEVGLSLLEKCSVLSKCSSKARQSIKQSLSELIVNSKSMKEFSVNLPDTSLSHALGMMLDVPHVRQKIPNIIKALTNNDPSKLEQSIKDIEAYYSKFNPGYLNFGSSIPLVQIITASENNLRPKVTKKMVQEEESDLLFASPLPGLIAENSMPTYSKDEFYSKLPSELPNTLVLQGTLDPKTHYAAAKKHVLELRKAGKVAFIEIEDGVHFTALNAPACFSQNVKQFISRSLANQSICRDKNVLVDFK